MNRLLEKNKQQRVAIIGLGHVGRATAAAIIHRRSCLNLCLLDIKHGLQSSVVRDFNTAASIDSHVNVSNGDYAAIEGADLIIIDAGVNEMEGGATNRHDPHGRLGLIDANVPVFETIAKKMSDCAKDSVVLVVSNPPDPLADFLRERITAKQVLSSGTYLDSMRLRGEIASALKLPVSVVEATVIGEHGMSSVILWSSVQIGGIPFDDYTKQQGLDSDTIKQTIEVNVRGANLDIIQGLGASQYGIGAMVARIAEAILRDQRIILPIGSYQDDAKLTYSLPSIIGSNGVERVLKPSLNAIEAQGFQQSIDALHGAKKRVQDAQA